MLDGRRAAWPVARGQLAAEPPRTPRGPARSGLPRRSDSESKGAATRGIDGEALEYTAHATEATLESTARAAHRSGRPPLSPSPNAARRSATTTGVPCAARGRSPPAAACLGRNLAVAFAAPTSPRSVVPRRRGGVGVRPRRRGSVSSAPSPPGSATPINARTSKRGPRQ